MCLIPFHFEIFNCRMSDPFRFNKKTFPKNIDFVHFTIKPIYGPENAFLSFGRNNFTRK